MKLLSLIFSALIFPFFMASSAESDPHDVFSGTDACMHLTEDNFDDVVMDPARNVLVYFYAPWCAHCKKLLPQYVSSCAVFTPEPTVTLALLDGTAAPALRAALNISGYPRLLFYPELPTDSSSTKSPVTYTGPRKHTSLVSFVNEQAGTYRHPNGTLGKDASLVASLDALVSTAEKYDSAFVEELDKEIYRLEHLTKSATGEGLCPRAQRAAHALYHSYATKTASKGAEYPQVEMQRLTRLINNPLTSAEKKDEFTKKLNVVTKFLGANYRQYSGEDGLVMVMDKLIESAEVVDDAFVAKMTAAAAEVNLDTSLYVMYAKKIAGSGSSTGDRSSYIAKELKRLAGLLASNGVLKHKKVSLQLRFNVLKRFQQLMRSPPESDTAESPAAEL